MADRDMVNHPSHYETGKFECIDVMLETQGYLATLGFCICNMFKYTYRHGSKNGREDIEKAGWYRDKYLELLDREGEFIKDRDDIANDLRKMLPSTYAHLITGTAIPEPPSVPDGMCAVKDIPEMEKDFSKYMNPPVEDEPQVNPDKDGWYDAMHLQLLPGYDPRWCRVAVPEGKVLELMLNNGATVIFKRDSILYLGGYGSDSSIVVRDVHSDDMSYDVFAARSLDESKFKEETND